MLGYAGEKYSLANKIGHKGGRYVRSSGGNFKMWNPWEFRGISQGRDRLHFWWVREPDGTVSSIAWHQLRRLLPDETVEMMKDRKRSERELLAQSKNPNR